MRTWTTDLTLNFTLHGFHCLTGVKARGWQGGPDNKTQAKYSVSRTRKKDAVWEEPAAWRSWAIPMVRWMMAGNVMIYFSEFINLSHETLHATLFWIKCELTFSISLWITVLNPQDITAVIYLVFGIRKLPHLDKRVDLGSKWAYLLLDRFKSWLMGTLEANCQSQGSPAIKQTLLYCLFYLID